MLDDLQRLNARLSAAGSRYGRVELLDCPGPLALTRGEADSQDLARVGRVLLYFAKKAVGPTVTARYSYGTRQVEYPVLGSAMRDDIAGWTI